MSNEVVSFYMRTLLVSGLLWLLAWSAFAQRFGYIDSQVVIEKMPEYKEAMQEVENLTQNWLAEIQKRQDSLTRMKDEFAAEELLLTPEMREGRLKKITEMEVRLRQYQNNTFGYEGLLFIKRRELMKPLQDKVAEAVGKVARKKKLNFLFDKAGDIVMIFSDPRHNYTDYVLEELGLGDPADIPR